MILQFLIGLTVALILNQPYKGSGFFRAIMLITTILAFIWTFNFFDLIYTLTRGGPANATKTVPIYIYNVSFDYFNFGLGSTISLLLIAMMTTGIVLYIRAVGIRRE